MFDRSSKIPVTGDPLTDILRGLRLDGVEYGRCEMKEPWGIQFPAQPGARFHFIGRKGCWLKQPSGEWVQLNAGDAVLLPRGEAHVLASEPGAQTWPIHGYELEEVCKDVYCTSNAEMCDKNCQPGTLLFCASMYFNLDGLHPLLGMMPDVMRTHELEAYEPGIPHLLESMAREVTMERVGSGGILARLADVLAATVIRSWVERGCGDSSGWIAAVRDRDIGRVLAAIHLEPDHDWTVEALARMMGASRSGFAERFATIVGETPAKYVTQVRMHQARQWLVRDRMKISVVAARLGYESDAAFSRAFKRVIGSAPSHFRAEEQAEIRQAG
ncbi:MULTISPECIES: AraC family transcriptional regulator [unclassified Mesorhizobium]|uniref:AraC family transcriptional regulator n=1 Tax=unclassified Mesorhizobium TaxID=325217 RepID=UPI001126BB39|nr:MULTISPECIES: AraC family transcriptional regulator [unclassified Mesorhizobium]TPL04372.1 AraC family transcriptional regulator [Mesorhizobium sp. B2-4-14]UCI30095.1 AraC family transcriptional regulator [Mesorhizobium sp. B4-1-4]